MKIVREHINERFTEKSDPIHDMDIGDKSVLFIEKLDKIAKSFGFTREDDIAAYNFDSPALNNEVLAVWTREKTNLKNIKQFGITLFRRYIFLRNDIDQYEMAYTSLVGSDTSLAVDWLNWKKWRYHFDIEYKGNNDGDKDSKRTYK